MKFSKLHSWDISAAEAIAIQERLHFRVKRRRDFGRVRTVAGADIAIDERGKNCIAAVITFSYPTLTEVERAVAMVPLKFPYIPGLLSFREGPALLAAFGKLSLAPDIVLFDGQGIAHPRGFGLASHMGLWLGLPTIGCAKSRLTGEHADPGQGLGDWAPLYALSDQRTNGPTDKVIGAVLCTRRGVKPIYVSIGHRIGLKSAIKIVMGCLGGTRIPKPTKEADHLVGMLKRGRLTSMATNL